MEIFFKQFWFILNKKILFGNLNIKNSFKIYFFLSYIYNVKVLKFYPYA